MKRYLSILLALALALSCVSSAAMADVPELKGPGNVTLKRLGYNVAFDPNTDGVAKLTEEVPLTQISPSSLLSVVLQVMRFIEWKAFFFSLKGKSTNSLLDYLIHFFSFYLMRMHLKKFTN